MYNTASSNNWERSRMRSRYSSRGGGGGVGNGIGGVGGGGYNSNAGGRSTELDDGLRDHKSSSDNNAAGGGGQQSSINRSIFGAAGASLTLSAAGRPQLSATTLTPIRGREGATTAGTAGNGNGNGSYPVMNNHHGMGISIEDGYNSSAGAGAASGGGALSSPGRELPGLRVPIPYLIAGGGGVGGNMNMNRSSSGTMLGGGLGSNGGGGGGGILNQVQGPPVALQRDILGGVGVGGGNINSNSNSNGNGRRNRTASSSRQQLLQQQQQQQYQQQQQQAGGGTAVVGERERRRRNKHQQQQNIVASSLEGKSQVLGETISGGDTSAGGGNPWSTPSLGGNTGGSLGGINYGGGGGLGGGLSVGSSLPQLTSLGSSANPNNKHQQQQQQQQLKLASLQQQQQNNGMISGGSSGGSSGSYFMNMGPVVSDNPQTLPMYYEDRSSSAVTSIKGLKPGNPNWTNQDNYFIVERLDGREGLHVFCVLDGHGEHGHIVSRKCREEFIGHIRAAQCDMRKAFYQMQSELCASDVDVRCSGATCVMVMINNGNRLSVGNCGDSRAVLGRRGANNVINAHALTNDHKPDRPEERKRILAAGGHLGCRQVMVNQGGRGPVGMPVGPCRVWYQYRGETLGLAMSRSLGDSLVHRSGVSAEPEIIDHIIDDQDEFIIIATDGVWDVVDSNQAVQLVSSVVNKAASNGSNSSNRGQWSALEATNILTKFARARWEKLSPMVDDITCVVIKLSSLR